MSKHYSRTVHSTAERSDNISLSYWFVFVLVLSVFSFSNVVSAQDVIAAARAFSRAQKADLAGDHEIAAELFELADSLAPSPEALRSALRSRKAANQLGTAALHAERLRKRYPYDGKSQELVRSTLLLAKQNLMRFEIDCRPRACTVLVDDAAAVIDPGNRHIIYVKPGTHEVIASFNEVRSDPKFVDAKAGKRGSLLFIYSGDAVEGSGRASLQTVAESDAGGSNTDLRTTNDERISIWYFLSGVAVTVGAGAATLWSGLDVLNLHDKYEENQTQEIYEKGIDKEIRTNVLIGVTAVAGAATCVLALFTEWDTSPESDSRSGLQATVGFDSNSGLFEISGAF